MRWPQKTFWIDPIHEHARRKPMRRVLKIVLAGVLLLSLSIVSVSKEASPFIEVEVKGVSIDSVGQAPVVILVDKEGKRAFPIWIGTQEAMAIDKELKNSTSPRPMTHDLLYSILSQMQVKVKEIRILELKNNTYYASLFLTSNKEVFEVDARPSDSIILALKSKAPIYVSTRLLDEQGIVLNAKNAFGERNGIRLQELTLPLASQFNFKGQKGVLVAEVISGSTSEASGIKAGDIITRVNSKDVGGVSEFEEAFDAAKKVGSVRLSIFREGKTLDVNLK
jgi:bifunctional DNase/RNase